MSDNELIPGLYAKAPHPKAPDYVKAAISIQPAKLSEWLAQHQGEEWVNVQVKESRGGKWYAAVDTWKPQAKREAPVANADRSKPDEFIDDQIPF